MLQALIFDFDGVVVDSEPVHCAGFQAILKDRYDIDITLNDYYERYLAYTDAEAFGIILCDHGRDLDAATLAELIEAKTALVHEMFRRDIRALPGAVELMASARQAGLAVAICSGALRDEIELAARAVGALQHVQLIVSAEDVPAGKPDPAGYRLARRRLAETLGQELPDGACVAIEDAPAGIVAARGAGLAVLAVTTSTQPDQLAGANRVVTSLADVTLDDLRQLA